MGGGHRRGDCAVCGVGVGMGGVVSSIWGIGCTLITYLPFLIHTTNPTPTTNTRLSQRSASTPARKVVVIEGTEFVIDPRYEVTRCVLICVCVWAEQVILGLDRLPSIHRSVGRSAGRSIDAMDKHPASGRGSVNLSPARRFMMLSLAASRTRPQRPLSSLSPSRSLPTTPPQTALCRRPCLGARWGLRIDQVRPRCRPARGCVGSISYAGVG